MTAYPAGTVRALLHSDLVTPQTPNALQERLKESSVSSPRFFTDLGFALLKVVEVWTLDRYVHTAGTCRMGAEPGNAGVNADRQAHDVPGLFIADNSVIQAL